MKELENTLLLPDYFQLGERRHPQACLNIRIIGKKHASSATFPAAFHRTDNLRNPAALLIGLPLPYPQIRRQIDPCRADINNTQRADPR